MTSKDKQKIIIAIEEVFVEKIDQLTKEKEDAIILQKELKEEIKSLKEEIKTLKATNKEMSKELTSTKKQVEKYEKALNSIKK